MNRAYVVEYTLQSGGTRHIGDRIRRDIHYNLGVKLAEAFLSWSLAVLKVIGYCWQFWLSLVCHCQSQHDDIIRSSYRQTMPEWLYHYHLFVIVTLNLMILSGAHIVRQCQKQDQAESLANSPTGQYHHCCYLHHHHHNHHCHHHHHCSHHHHKFIINSCLSWWWYSQGEVSASLNPPHSSCISGWSSQA